VVRRGQSEHRCSEARKEEVHDPKIGRVSRLRSPLFGGRPRRPRPAARGAP
jgi:hypothetical protein